VRSVLISRRVSVGRLAFKWAIFFKILHLWMTLRWFVSPQRSHLILFWRILVLSCSARRPSFAVMSLTSSQPISWGSAGRRGTQRWCQSYSSSPVLYRTSLLFWNTGSTRFSSSWRAQSSCWRRTETCGGPEGPASLCRSTVSGFLSWKSYVYVLFQNRNNYCLILALILSADGSVKPKSNTSWLISDKVWV